MKLSAFGNTCQLGGRSGATGDRFLEEVQIIRCNITFVVSNDGNPFVRKERRVNSGVDAMDNTRVHDFFV